MRDDASRLQTYTYRVGETLREAVGVGHLVQVPLQAGWALGVVVAVSEMAPPGVQVEAVRDLAQVLDPVPVVTPAQIGLARWVAAEYLAPLSQAMRLMLPPGLEGLVRDGKALVPPKPAPPRVQYARLLADEQTIRQALPRLGRPSKQADALLAVARRADAPPELADLCQSAGCSPESVQALAQRGWVRITEPRTLVVAAVPDGADAAERLERAPKQAAALAALRAHGGPADRQAFLADSGVSPAAFVELERKGLVRRVAEPALVLLTLPEDQVLDRIVELRGGEKERAVLDALRDTAGRVWVGGLYAQTGADLPTLQRLSARGLISLHAAACDRPSLLQPEKPMRLTADQESVWNEIRSMLEGPAAGAAEAETKLASSPAVALLHGVTGSGKTEVYLHAIEQVLAAGQRSVVLVPEISLTAQTVRRFEARFPGRVAVLHSRLTKGQRYAVWDGVRRGETDVLIGPRSALLAPMSRLALIVVDEAHDESYKQGEPIPLPPYHACDAAVELGRLTGAAVVMGSATPDLVRYYRATQGAYRLLELPRRIASGAVTARGQETTGPVPLPAVRIVDLRQELRAGNRSIFSRALQAALRQTLAAKEQAILFLNRRGAATFVLCRDCGYVAHCPRCDAPLTFHRRRAGSGAGQEESGEAGLLRCHRCNYHEPVPARCPRCNGRRIRYFGLGTERVEAELKQLMPEARLLRWDADTASGVDHERYLHTFVEHRADVLVGTQMIAKGLDLPLVTLVGVLSADTALHLPDYRSAERTFQLLTQVAGRAGRSRRGGQVIFQTYQPEQYALQAAAGHDYAAFFDREVAYRQQLGYPPFGRLVALRCYDEDARRCQAEAERLGRWLAAEIRRLGVPDTLIGPAPCFFGRVQGRYRWQIVVRTPDPERLLGRVALPWGWHVDVDPVSLL